MKKKNGKSAYHPVNTPLWRRPTCAHGWLITTRQKVPGCISACPPARVYHGVRVSVNVQCLRDKKKKIKKVSFMQYQILFFNVGEGQVSEC